MKHDFDWSQAPTPWNFIGPKWRREVENIVVWKRPEPKADLRQREADGRLSPLRRTA